MDLIQLMGSSSANRTALGKVDFEGSSETVNFELGKDFKAQLKLAFLDGQDKEVNRDGLIAQQVALDLNLGQLPIPQVGNEQGLALSLSFGQNLGDSLDIDGVAITGDKHGGFCGVPYYTDGPDGDGKKPGFELNLVGIGKYISNLPDGEVKESLTAKLEMLKSGVYSREVKGALTELFQKFWTSMENATSGNSFAPTGFNEGGELQGPPSSENASLQGQIFYEYVNPSATEDADLAAVTSAESEAVDTVVGDAHNTARPRSDQESNRGILTADVETALVALSQGIDRLRNSEASNTSERTKKSVSEVTGSSLTNGSELLSKSGDPFGGSKAPFLGQVGYKQTGQGRPDDRDWIFPGKGGGTNIEPGTLAKFNPPSINELKNPDFQKMEGRVISVENTAEFAVPEDALSAPQVIESIAGRLTRDSIGLSPKRISVDGAVDAVPVSAESGGLQPVNDSDFGQNPALRQRQTLTADMANKQVVDSQVATQDADQFANELMKGGANKVATIGATNVDLKNAVVNGEDEEFEISVDSLTSIDDSPEVSREFRTVDAKLTPTAKAAAEQAIRDARTELTETVMDLVAARRPQSVRIQLNPFEMGTIDVSVRTSAGRTDIDLRASDDAVRHGLSAQRGELVQSIESRGTTVSSMNVGHHAGQQFGQSEGQGGQQASRDDFRQAVTLGQFSTNADTLVASGSSYGTTRDGRVDLAA